MSNYLNQQAFQPPQQFVRAIPIEPPLAGVVANPPKVPTHSQGQNRPSRRAETPILPPQVPTQFRASPSSYRTQQPQQSQQNYHRAGDQQDISFEFTAHAIQALEQSHQNQQQQQQQQQHPQFLPQTPQHGQQPSTQSQEESMQDVEEQEFEMESEGDGDANDETTADADNTTGNNTAKPAESGEPHVAPLVQPITPLQLPKIRPTLKLGPYDTREEAMNTVQEYAIAQGYCLVQSGCAKQKTPGGKYTPVTEVVRVDLMCDRGGTCKNIGTGKRKRPTHKLGCPTRIKLVCRKREASKWFIDIRCEEHNHDLDPRNMESIASYRRWRRVQGGGPSTEPLKERHARTRKPKTIPPVPPPKFHQTGGLNEQPPTAPTGPLHMAALKGQAKILAILLDKGANINALDATGRTALHCAVEGMRFDIVQLLVQRGADVTICDAKGISPLHTAVEKGMEDAVVYFIENGADPN
ncbi:hypothetical protein B0T16DRAFT_417693, partial [Cercophora newfieldiana]